MALPINHILCPTDFSKNAEHALQFAAEIASKTDAKLTLFHASQVKMDLAPNFEKKKEHLIEEEEKQIEKLIENLKDDRYGQLSISTLIKEGQTVSAILNQIKEQEVDLIVMGTKGATANRNALFGSVASSVIQKSSVPVLTIPNGSGLNNFNNISFATDFKEGDPLALQLTVSFAELFDASVQVLHVSDHKDMKADIQFRGFRDLIRERIDYDKLSFYHKYDMDFFPSVAESIIENPESMLVMTRYRKSFWEKLAKRDHSKEMSFYSQIPLLVLLGNSNTKEKTAIWEETQG